jgi:hypothetical protein
MIYQTDPGFSAYPQIKHGACYFLSILRALSDKFAREFTHEVVLAFYLAELANGKTDVDNEMFVGDPQALVDDFIGAGKVLFIGKKDADYKPAPNEIAWGCWHRAGTDFNHFTYGINPKVSPFYDPWSAEGSASVAQGQLIGQRIALIL